MRPHSTTTPPNPDPVAIRMREWRKARGWSLGQLATETSREVPVSISYLSLIENGRKVPDETIAVALARALGDDEELYRAWVHALKRTDLTTTMEAADALRRFLDRSAPEPAAATAASPAFVPIPEARVVAPLPVFTPIAEAEVSSAPAGAGVASRVRVPLIAPGDDPGETHPPACPVLRTLRIDARRLGPIERIVRPFAVAVDEATARHLDVPFVPGQIAVVSRHEAAPAPGARAAVRMRGGVQLRRVMWNGQQLLLLPAPGGGDFDMLHAPFGEVLRMHLVGAVVAVVPEETGA